MEFWRWTGRFSGNHRVPESQVPDLVNPTPGRYEDSIIQDLIPAIENGILHGPVRIAAGSSG